ncbi:MAG: flagellar export chaperone FliS [Pseudomonadota bacterium]
MNPGQKQAMAYANIGLETGVAAASPHRLILMLYDGALIALVDAQKHLEAKNIPGKGQAISKALQIIDEGLKASLDETSGGEIAVHLKDLYDYMTRRLLLASLRNQVEPVIEVRNLLGQLREAWEAIGKQVDAQAASGTPQTNADTKVRT